MSEVWKLGDMLPAEKLALLCLADNANNDGVCWPSVQDMAQRLMCTPRYVYELVAALEKKGFVSRESRKGKSTIYHIVLTPEPQFTHTPEPQFRTELHNTPEPQFIPKNTPPLNPSSQTPEPQFIPTPELGFNSPCTPYTDNHHLNHKEPSSRGTRFALQDPPNEWIQFCITQRPDLDPGGTFDAFRDYWISKPGKDGVKLDWTATWRNWVRKQYATGGNHAKPPAENKHQRLLEAAERARIANERERNQGV